MAIRWGLVIRNACDAIDAPKAVGKDIQPLTSEQAATLMRESKSDRLHALFVLAVTTGIRQGELFGLTPEDVDGSTVDTWESAAEALPFTPSWASQKAGELLSTGPKEPAPAGILTNWLLPTETTCSLAW